MTESLLITVATFDDPTIAHISRSRLESAGVRAVLDGEHHVAMDWFITNAVGGVKLLVDRANRDAALQILSENRSETIETDEFDDDSDGLILKRCPNCNSPETYRERLHRKWIFISILLLGMPLPFFSRKMICERCDHRWIP